ncbi:MAG TPA: acyltransferase, partial [Polyangiaceae bacterium]|nr:acyltransferase [Polyangiaceae bacterium]
MQLSPAKLGSYFNDGRAVLRAQWYLRHATSLGPLTRLWGTPAIRNEGTLIVGERVRLVSTVATLEMGVGPQGTLEIGKSTFVNYGTSIAALASVKIGPNCSIGTYCLIMDNDFHRVEPERRNELPESLPIAIEENVWLGARVMVLRGVSIGAGSVVGAGSIVTHDVEPRSLVTGMPA